MSTTTEPTIETPNPASVEALKAAWEKLNQMTPDGCEMTLYFEGHYSNNISGGKPWEYVGVNWKVHLRDGHLSKATNFAFGGGETPDTAMSAAIADLASKRRAVEKRELGEFKEWRAARERTGQYTPHDRDGWNKAVSETPSEDDE